MKDEKDPKSDDGKEKSKTVKEEQKEEKAGKDEGKEGKEGKNKTEKRSLSKKPSDGKPGQAKTVTEGGDQDAEKAKDDGVKPDAEFIGHDLSWF